MALFMKGKNVFITILPKQLWNSNWYTILVSVNWKTSVETRRNGNLLINPVHLNWKSWVDISRSGNWLVIIVPLRKSWVEISRSGNCLVILVPLPKSWVEISRSGNWLVFLVPLRKSWVEIARKVRQKIENQYQTRREQSDSTRVTHATPQPVRLRSATRSEYKWAIKIHIDPKDLKRFKIFDTGNYMKSQRPKPNLKMDEANTTCMYVFWISRLYQRYRQLGNCTIQERGILQHSDLRQYTQNHRLPN